MPRVSVKSSWPGSSKKNTMAEKTREKYIQRARSGPAKFYGRTASSSDELKFFDTDVNTTYDLVPEVMPTGQLCLIPQGVTESTRVGRKCVIKSIQIDGAITHTPAASATASGVVTMMLVWDKQTNGAAATLTDIYSSFSGSLTQCVRNLDNLERFVVLKRWDIVINSPAGVTTAYNNVTKKVTYYTKCNIPLEFSSTTGAITELKTNNVFLIGGESGLGDDVPSIRAIARIRFSDN